MAAGHQIFVIVYYLLAEGSFDDDERDDHLQPRQLGKSCLTLEKDLLGSLNGNTTAATTLRSWPLDKWGAVLRRLHAEDEQMRRMGIVFE
jgi:hypothetical protein